MSNNIDNKTGNAVATTWKWLRRALTIHKFVSILEWLFNLYG